MRRPEAVSKNPSNPRAGRYVVTADRLRVDAALNGRVIAQCLNVLNCCLYWLNRPHMSPPVIVVELTRVAQL